MINVGKVALLEKIMVDTNQRIALGVDQGSKIFFTFPTPILLVLIIFNVQIIEREL